MVNYDHVVWVSIDIFPNSQRDVPYRHTVYDYSCVNWDALHDHLRDAPWKDILKLESSTATSKFYE